MANGWTEERKARQSELIHQWKPWESSTGARTPEAKAIVSRNAVKPDEITATFRAFAKLKPYDWIKVSRFTVVGVLCGGYAFKVFFNLSVS